MKLIFNFLPLLLILSSLNVFARDIIVITYEKDLSRAEKLRDYIQVKYSIPDKLIKMKWRAKPCRVIRDAIYQICLTNAGTFSFPIVKQTVLVNSFSIFKELADTKKANTNGGPF